MKLLHTSDWHVGKLMRGQSRSVEHDAVLAEISGIATDEEVDLILVVGDLFETAAPGPESEEIVYRHLLALAETGATVVVVAGNHDNPRRLGAVTQLLELGRVHVLAQAASPDDGGVLSFTTDAGEPVNLALLPFVSQRGIVRVDDLMATDADQHSQKYAARLRQVIEALTASIEGDDAVNLLAGHLMVAGGVMGGGERSAHTVFDYAVDAAAFPEWLHYVALGHLHRAQPVRAQPPAWYSGSPLQLDFGEESEGKAVLVVEAESGRPASVTEVPLTAGRRLRTIEGTLEELEGLVGTTGDDFLRVRVRDASGPAVPDQIRELFPEATEVVVDRPAADPRVDNKARLGRSPAELFEEYLGEVGEVDGSVLALFDELHDEVTSAT